MLKKILQRLIVLALLLFVAIQFVRPARTNPMTDSTLTIQASLKPPTEVTAILERACFDCHSHQTRWPWYSNVAPLSRLVIDHVNHGRRHLNFSEWAQADREKMLHQLEEIEETVQHRSMPLESYTLIHRNAKLSDAEINRLTAWARSERERMRTIE